VAHLVDVILTTLGWQHAMISATSAVICVLIVLLVPHMPRLTGDANNLNTVQALHKNPTARVGGIAIFAAITLGIWFAPLDVTASYAKFIAATGVLFLVGLLEDLGFRISPTKRLFAAFMASACVVIFLQVWMPRTGIPQLDGLMMYWWVGVPLTLLVTAGIANGFNLIDGVNGLAALTAMVGAAALALIAAKADYATMTGLSSLLAAAVFGFFVFNFPFGKIFLGDAGAYTLGFVLSWFAISILLNAPEVTPWALLLTLFWPVADTFLAVSRRQRKSTDTMAPDRLHVHQLVMRALEIYALGRNKRHIANPLSTVVLAPFVITPAIAGVLLWDQPRAAFMTVIAFTILFFTSYILAFPVLKRLDRLKRRP
jgi:UDP-GlcNAc:undecaprenyl-phosphate GlcNAc-1-phosphate transferase